jgi:uncharacterized protein (TIRG00374 family)
VRNWRSLAFWFLRLGVAAGVLAWLQASGSISWSLLAGLLVAWPVTVAAVALFVVDSVITASRLCVLLNPTGSHISIYNSVRLTFMGLFFTVCLPGGAGGDAVRIYYASIGNQGSRAELATVILLDRLVGMFAMFLWPVLAAPFFLQLLENVPLMRSLVTASALAALALLAGMLLTMWKRFRHHAWIVWLFRHAPFGSLLERITDTLHGYRHHPAALLGAVGISLIAHTLAVGVALLVAVAINPAAFSWQMSMLVPLGFLANALPFTPGGLGVGEAAFDVLFRMTGLEGGPPIMLGWRLVMFLASLWGIVFYLQGKKRLIHARPGIAVKTVELQLPKDLETAVDRQH